MLLYGVRIASISGNDVLYIYRDRLGSVVATSRSGGRPGASYRYTPYGAQDLALGDTAAAASDLGHNGARKLTGGLLHLNARVYDPRLRRFLQPDNVDLLRYTYAAGDPANRTDPTGHWWNSGKTHIEFHVLWNERALVTGSWAAGTSADPFVAHVKQFEEASGDARDEIARMAKNAQPAFGTKTWAQYDAEVAAQNTTAPPDPEGKGKAGTAGTPQTKSAIRPAPVQIEAPPLPIPTSTCIVTSVR